jgi:phage N-6-adenine-methyltransferase
VNRDAYQTPPEVFAPLNAEFNFALDVCASNLNALLPHYITEQDNCLTADWCYFSGSNETTGWYAWMNPPYSDIGPFVKRAAEMAAQGIGTVMLVMMDQSVGWYRDAIKTCQEVRLVIGGRLSFIDPSTGKPAAGNNKGSMFIIWHPFGRTPVQYSHIERDEMLAAGRALLEQACVSGTAETETQPALTAESAPQTKAPELITLEFTSEQLAEQIASGKLPFSGDHLALMLQLEGMFGQRTTFTSSQVKMAVLAFDEPSMVSKSGVAA